MSCHRLQRPVVDWIIRQVKLIKWKIRSLIFSSQLKVFIHRNWSFTCRNSRRHQICQVCAQRWFSQTCHHRHLGSQVMLRFLSNARLDLTCHWLTPDFDQFVRAAASEPFSVGRKLDARHSLFEAWKSWYGDNNSKEAQPSCGQPMWTWGHSWAWAWRWTWLLEPPHHCLHSPF